MQRDLAYQQSPDPTYNHAADAARHPKYREEPFQMRPGRLPINLRANMRPRPRARSGSSPASQMSLARVPVLVRDGNNRPIEAGEGHENSRWGVSDPSWHAIEQRAFNGAIPGIGALEGTSKLLAVGAALGLAAWLLIRK